MQPSTSGLPRLPFLKLLLVSLVAISPGHTAPVGDSDTLDPKNWSLNVTPSQSSTTESLEKGASLRLALGRGDKKSTEEASQFPHEPQISLTIASVDQMPTSLWMKKGQITTTDAPAFQGSSATSSSVERHYHPTASDIDYKRATPAQEALKHIQYQEDQLPVASKVVVASATSRLGSTEASSAAPLSTIEDFKSYQRHRLSGLKGQLKRKELREWRADPANKGKQLPVELLSLKKQALFHKLLAKSETKDTPKSNGKQKRIKLS